MQRLTSRRLIALAAVALLVASCGSASSSEAIGDGPEAVDTTSIAADTPEVEETVDSQDTADDASWSPVTIEHVYGTTTIDVRPERVATVAWSNHEVPLALGIVPVGMSKATWGDDDGDGILPWVEAHLDELGAEAPVLFDETDGIDFEAVADSQPDLILATYSGISQEDYDTLSSIAPTIAYPEVAWGTTMDEMIRTSSAALGLEAEGEALLDDIATDIEAALSAHPALEGRRVLFAYIDPTDLSQIGFYTSHDTRPGFLMSLGLPMPAIVEEESAKTTDFYVSVSSELADRFADVDLFVTYGDADGSMVEQLRADPLLSQIPAIANGSIAILENSTPLAASANPSPLSIGWGIEDYFALLAGGLQPAE